jgi:hypothetical protein
MTLTHNKTSIWFYLIILLLIVTTFYGARRLATDPFWVDEVIAIERAGAVWYDTSSTLSDVWNRTVTVSDQVPGYYILLALWAKVVGLTPFALRALSLFCGVITIATTYQLGKRLHSEVAGFAAALALISSAFYVLFLHQARTYALLLCLIALLLWCYWLIVHGKVRWWNQAGLVICAAGMLYCYYLSIVVLAALCLYHLLFVPKKREWWRVVVLMILAAILFLPWLSNSMSILEDSNRNAMRTIHTIPALDGIVRIGSAFSNQNNAALVFLLLFAAIQLRLKSLRYVWFLGVTILAVLIILNQPLGVLVNVRYALLLWLPLALLVGFGVERLVKFGVPSAAVLGVLFITGLASISNPRLIAEYELPIRYLPWDTLTDITRQYEQEGDTLVFLTLIEGDDWEGGHEDWVMPYFYYNSPIDPVFIEDVRTLPDASLLAEGEQVTQNAERVWLSYAPKLRSWRMGMFEAMLAENGFARCGNFADNDTLYLDLYAHPNAVNTREAYRFGDEAENAVAQLTPLQAVPQVVDATLPLIHAWTLSENLPRNTYSLAVHILDTNDTVVAQADYGLPAEPFACAMTQIPVQDLAVGDYRVRSFVYAWQDGSRLPLVDGDEAVILGTFAVR